MRRKAEKEKEERITEARKEETWIGWGNRIE